VHITEVILRSRSQWEEVRRLLAESSGEIGSRRIGATVEKVARPSGPWLRWGLEGA
jgi:hypothetical protein